MTSTHTTTQLEQQLDAAWTALRHTHGEEAVAAAFAHVDAVVTQISQACPMATLGDLRLHAKALLAWHDGYYGDAPDSLEQLLIALEDLPKRLWNEKI